MIQAAIGIAESLHVPTIAEGVETEEQLTGLKNMGCDIVQGYYFSMPVPSREYEEHLKKWRSTLCETEEYAIEQK
jgi:EAL domain-containing protein (putative c-di-GMP-specific phosphodiesterase class I)